MAEHRLKHFGWGREGAGMTEAEVEFVLARARDRFGVDRFDEVALPRLEDLKLAAPRIAPPAALAPICSTAPFDRAAHTYGKGYVDYVRGMEGDYDAAPDVVAFPRREAEVAALCDWAGGAQAAIIPFGGGSSVVGGVEPSIDRARYKAALTIDMRELGGVLEVDRTSRAARIAGGAFGPALEAALKPHDLTLRHFPQSFEYSTLGGWIATRSGGHFATLYTHIDDLVESAAHGDAQGRPGEPAAARLGRGAQPRPHGHRLGRHSRHHHRGVGAASGPAALPRRRRRALQGFLHRGARAPGRSRSPGFIPPTAASSIPRRPITPAPATARRRSWCWPSSQAIIRSSHG